MRVIILIFCMFGAVASVMAEDFEFDHTTYDFGTIKESEGEVSHEFRFYNSGKKPAVIYNVRLSCGCTKASYSTEPIFAGDSSSIVVTYNPFDRPGVFMRDIYIFSTASDSPLVLRITGVVEGRQLSLEDRYPCVVDERVRVSTSDLSVGSISRGFMSSAGLELINVGADVVRVELRSRVVRDYLNDGFVVELDPREGAVMEVGYLVEQATQVELGEDGRLVDTLDLFVDGQRSGSWVRLSGILLR